MRNIRRNIIISIIFCFLVSSVFADTIYLKNGKIIKGKIVEANTESITVETDTEWFKINREDIEKIKFDKKVVEKPTPKEKPEEVKGDTYYAGKKDGEIAGGAESQMVTGGAAGCCLGPIGYIFIPMAGTEPSSEKMESIKDKSEEYKQGYRDGYKGKKKSSFMSGVTIGWLAWIATIVVVSVNQ